MGTGNNRVIHQFRSRSRGRKEYYFISTSTHMMENSRFGNNRAINKCLGIRVLRWYQRHVPILAVDEGTNRKRRREQTSYTQTLNNSPGVHLINQVQGLTS